MKHTIAAALLMLTAASPLAAAPFTLGDGYVQADGAILTYPNNQSFIDPYFPTKALLVASDNGLNNTHLTHGWINWLLARQENDGLFSRFCYDEDQKAHMACLVADADDSMMAMWIEILYRTAPSSGMPGAWKASAAKALAQLDALYDTQSGVYFISKAMPVGLLMDNIEIYAALTRAGKEAKRLGDKNKAAELNLRAARLKIGILKTFWDNDAQRFKISTQTRPEEGFYPDDVAQIIPMLHGFDAQASGSDDHFYSAWMDRYRHAWFELIGKDYPWGLVAVVATQRKDLATAGCWVQQVAPHRHGGTWDVVDEAAFQAVESKLPPASAYTCAGVLS